MSQGSTPLDLSLRLIVEWPNGARLPVRVGSSATGEDLINLLRFSFTPDSICMLVHDNVYVKPGNTLACQMKENQIVKVLQVPKGSFSETDYSDSDDDDGEGFDGICSEVLRIADVQFNMIEGHRKGGVIMRNYLKEQSDTDESDSEAMTTVLGEKLTEIPSDPLPKWPVDQEDFPRYRTIGIGSDWRW